MLKQTSQILVPVLLLATTVMTGCSSADITEFQNALSSFTKNKSMAEQFVRDIKASVSPDDPSYIQTLEAYEDAKDSYNHLLYQMENAVKMNRYRLNLNSAVDDAQSKTAEFLKIAAHTLRPSMRTTQIPFERALEIPDTLPKALHDLPAKSRGKLVDRFDEDVRWRSWRQL